MLRMENNWPFFVDKCFGKGKLEFFFFFFPWNGFFQCRFFFSWHDEEIFESLLRSKDHWNIKSLSPFHSECHFLEIYARSCKSFLSYSERLFFSDLLLFLWILNFPWTNRRCVKLIKFLSNRTMVTNEIHFWRSELSKENCRFDQYEVNFPQYHKNVFKIRSNKCSKNESEIVQ